MSAGPPTVGEDIVIHRKESVAISGTVTRIIESMKTTRPTPACIELGEQGLFHVRREAGEWWDAHENTVAKRRVGMLWKALADAGAFRYGRMARMDTWLRGNCGVAHESFLTEEEAERVALELGAWLKRIEEREPEMSQ